MRGVTDADNSRMRAAGWRLAWLCAAASLLPLMACQSTSGSSPHVLATVNIPGNTPGQVRAAAIEVFKQQGYQLAGTTAKQTTFEKPGSRWDNLAYGSWLDDTTWVRVKVEFLQTADPGCRVEARAFWLRDRGGPTEEELPVGNLNRKPYQKLLDEIAARFAHAPG